MKQWLVLLLWACSTVSANGQLAVNDPIGLAAQRGERYLRSIQQPDGGWHHPSSQNTTGATALAALALLEGGANAQDPAIAKTANLLRQRVPGMSGTYSISLAILFFDRLGDPGDLPLIQALGVRLALGQEPRSAGWSYNCDVPIDEPEMQKRVNEIRLRILANPTPEESKEKAAKPKPRPELPATLRNQLQEYNARMAAAAQGGLGLSSTDNSNTQFAILGLWVARRHGVPVAFFLERTAERFRLSQGNDGGWGYAPGMNSTPAMTCAGLLALAMSHAVRNELIAEADAAKDPAKAAARKPATAAKDVANDPAVRFGLLFLGTFVGEPVDPRVAAQAPALLRINRGHYFLWSMERVAVGYNLATLNKKDWYRWGAQILLANQEADGSWRGEYAEGGVDTSFALLFLRRANFAADLSSWLKDRVQDPGAVSLKSGGVGGEGIKGKVQRSPFEANMAASSGRKGKTSDDPLRAEAEKHADELARASAAEQPEVLKKLQSGKGPAFSLALAVAIPQLEGLAKTKAREALAERFSRMTSATVRERMHDEDVEIRRAAALASAMREDKALAPDLVGLLQDKEATVVRAAHAALKDLTGQDFGPAATATAEEREQAVAKWKAWLTKSDGK